LADYSEWAQPLFEGIRSSLNVLKKVTHIIANATDEELRNQKYRGISRALGSSGLVVATPSAFLEEKEKKLAARFTSGFSWLQRCAGVLLSRA
jgi:hypothetical protein